MSDLHWSLREHLKDFRKDGRLFVLVSLYLRRNTRNRAWPSNETIAEETGLSKSPISNSIKWLVDHHAIMLVPYDKRIGDEKKCSNNKNIYQLTGVVEINGKYTPYMYMNPEGWQGIIAELEELGDSLISRQLRVVNCLNSDRSNSGHPKNEHEVFPVLDSEVDPVSNSEVLNTPHTPAPIGLGSASPPSDPTGLVGFYATLEEKTADADKPVATAVEEKSLAEGDASTPPPPSSATPPASEVFDETIPVNALMKRNFGISSVADAEKRQADKNLCYKFAQAVEDKFPAALESKRVWLIGRFFNFWDQKVINGQKAAKFGQIKSFERNLGWWLDDHPDVVAQMQTLDPIVTDAKIYSGSTPFGSRNLQPVSNPQNYASGARPFEFGAKKGG